MINLNTNLSSLTAQRSLTNSTYLLNQAIERMSTGFKINHASDNAANYSISTNMTTKIGAYQVAEENVAMGLDLLSTANGSLDLISDKLSRLRALAEQASNGTYGERSLKSINTEANAIVDEIERIYSTAEYNGIKLFGEGVNGGSFIEEVNQRDTSSMTKLSSVDPTTTISSGTYSISTAEELAKLAEMTNNGNVTGGEFVLANNIDLSAYSSGEGWTPIGNGSNSFTGTFDGNEYVVSNLYINTLNTDAQGLFGYVENGSIKNLGVKNTDITGNQYVGALCGGIINGAISNCYSTGSVKGGGGIGGLIGISEDSNVSYCYSNCNTDGVDWIGGLIGAYLPNNLSSLSLENCYATGNIVASGACVGGLIGLCGDADITKCYATGNISGDSNVGNFIGYLNQDSITDCYATGTVNGVEFVDDINNTNPYSVSYNQLESSPRPFVFDTEKSNSALELNFQAGINSSQSSQILLNTSLNLDFSSLRGIGSGGDYLSQIDSMLNTISSTQTQLGAAENRLESALEEISTQYDNLVSSRSTLRDADIAEVSSKYIRQQILQQASATLLATANQSPALALQLL